MAGFDDFDDFFNNARCTNRVKLVRELLKNPRFDPGSRDNQFIIDAVNNGCIEIVKILLKHPRVNPAAQYNGAIRLAVVRNELEIVRELIKDHRVDVNCLLVILNVIQYNRINIIRELLGCPRFDPTAQDNYLIRAACSSGRRSHMVSVLSKDIRIRFKIMEDPEHCLEFIPNVFHELAFSVFAIKHLKVPVDIQGLIKSFMCRRLEYPP